MSRLKPGGLAALALLAALPPVLAACGRKNPGAGGPGGPPEVGVIAVQPQPVPLTAELSGRTSAFLVSEVRPQVSGVIKARLFTEGSNVRAGQPLYQIDPATYQASLASARAGLAQAQAAYATAKLKADRYRDLVKMNAVSKQDNDDAQAAAQQAAANVQAQRAAVQQAQINLGYTHVLAPISGRVGKSSVTPGALVTASQAAPLATVQNLERIYVDVTQSTADLLRLKHDLAAGKVATPGTAQVTLVLEDGSVYPTPGSLAFSDVTVDPGTGSVGLRAVFPNRDGLLLPGMYVRARLAKGMVPNGMLVPQVAVARDPAGNATALVVGAGNKAELRQLQTAQTVGDKWLVTGGLKPGERVIVDGLQHLQPGAPVKPVPAGAKR
ncbi:efflux RND transporter periplasmic adaptor subunit [Phenylobacterium sp.]|jgi:membrane fusion protein (multidrug efflux system)|uniref:efflux RND transporter periplasmic adaptor subunit n=1 Tax=Phenylobacterium sp. TaxID=1871053 RepID=UPI002F3F6897